MNPNDIATKQDIQRLQDKIDLLIQRIDTLKLSDKNHEEEVYLTSGEVMKIYKISKTHLSNLRTEGKIPYSKPFGILLYPKYEIEKAIKTSQLRK
jgi:hypothetical protein